MEDPLPARGDGAEILEFLKQDVEAARDDVRAKRRDPVDRAALLEARHALLHALDAYADALTARHLPIPWRMRDDLRLQRAQTGVRQPPYQPSTGAR